MGRQAVLLFSILCGVVIGTFGTEQLIILAEHAVKCYDPQYVFQYGMCRCKHLTWKCCAGFEWKNAKIFEVCIQVSVMPDDFTVALGMDFNDISLVEETVSPEGITLSCRNTPELGDLLGSICVEPSVLNVSTEEKKFETCLVLHLFGANGIKIIDVKLPCINFEDGEMCLK